MSDTVQKVKDRISITDVVSQYVTLSRAGVNLKGRCPFHSERTPSFIVSPARGTYHCFGCSAHGDIFTFVQEIEGLDFKASLTMLAERAGVEVVFEGKGEKTERDEAYDALSKAASFYASQLTKTHPARKYLHTRGLTDETIESFQIGFAPREWSSLSNHLRSLSVKDTMIEHMGLGKRGEKGIYDRFRSRIMFPIFDASGRVVAFSGRIFGEDEKGGDAPKYINSPETKLFQKSHVLYGYDRAKRSIRTYDCAVLVEGQMDLVMSHQAGWSNTVAVSGTALTPEHVELLRRMSDNVVLALDADEAGVQAAQRSARVALSLGMDVKVARLPMGMDPADLIVKEGVEAWRKSIREAKHVVLFLLDALEEKEKDNRHVRKAVEDIVLPFVAGIKSPIDREHFVREIADRIGISEKAILESLHAIPVVREDTDAPVPTSEKKSRTPIPPRYRQVFGLVLWQESLESPHVPLEDLLQELERAIGSERMERFRSLPDDVQEELRMSAELHYGENPPTPADAFMLVTLLQRARLEKDLEEATVALRKAEHAENEKETALLLEKCNTLREAIAKIERVG